MRKVSRTSCCHVCKTSMNQYQRDHVECTTTGCNKIVCNICFSTRLNEGTYQEAASNPQYRCPQCTGTCPCERCARGKAREAYHRIMEEEKKVTPSKTSPPKIQTSSNGNGATPNGRRVGKRKKKVYTSEDDFVESNGYDTDEFIPKVPRESPVAQIQQQQNESEMSQMRESLEEMLGTIARLSQDMAEMKRDHSALEKKLSAVTNELQYMKQQQQQQQQLQLPTNTTDLLLNQLKVEFDSTMSPQMKEPIFCYDI
ncbi:hypothetical protein PROFUN_05095 [Planoprotostelium fungivorum]|uniref:Zinc-finger domain-containing protein n=1 Tax=Planoprotostelium fungivorum TaxID=1890364 RepID=A0A2P6NRN6_9EUKA|nr:hypothetical protein PROFUN_05095 [Planoprotostelium fungivorum]